PGEFRARKGYDLLPHLESLFCDTGPIDRKIRCDFHGLIAELCAETFFGGLRAWCRRHGVASSGHLLGEENLIWQTMFNGEPFACYRNFDIPGIDMITSDPEKIMAKDYFMVPKVAGSAGRLQGSRRLMCEISDFFGIMDRHHASRAQMECTAGILFSFGVTDLCSYYTLSFQPEETLKPGEFSVRTYRPYTDFVTRLNARFTAATVETHVAVLHPIVALQAHYVPSTRSMYEPHPRADVNFLDGAFTDLCRGLLQHQIDFDVVDEAGLAGAKIEGPTLAVGERRYRVLVLPPLDTIRLGTMAAIERFAAAGGVVLAHPLMPRYAAEGPDGDARIGALVSQMRAAGALVVAEPGSPPLASRVKTRVAPGCELAPSWAHLLCTTLTGPAGRAYFLVNTSAQAYVGTGTFPASGRPVLCDPSSGEERLLPGERMGGSSTRVALALCPFESVFVDFRPAAG
ncbi:MAG: glycosyl hydrolase, partial [Opitutales bacterium]